MQFSYAFVLALVAPIAAVLAVPTIETRAKSGSKLTAFTDDSCSTGYFTLTDQPNDGVQGTNCFNAWVRGEGDTAVYRTIQSINTENLQDGCVAHVFKNLDCQGEVLGVTSQSDDCHRNFGDWFGLSAQITC